ncbi:MAG: ATP-binding protein [Burkholderiales bacterium]|nr:ATP-binding protein [Burkholderiales bacterium]
MFTRRLPLPTRSFLLLGPRGTGKTTWLRERLARAHAYNLLLDRELLRLMRDPGSFRREIDALPRGSWVVVDEVQKLPSLLNEIHDALTSAPRHWRFALTGSSARRLRRENVNLLAGRVITRRMLPLTLAEMTGPPATDDLLRFGGLPLVRSERAHAARIDLLEAYVETYLTQEIRAEALVRSLESFTRFLEVAALANGQVTNVAGLARDAAVARPTVQGYFEVLADTLIGVWLPSWRPRTKVKEVSHPKFYLFDTGVVRALSGRQREPLDAAERGVLLETWVLHELRAQIAYSDCGGELSYYRTPSGTEVDFVWRRGGLAVGIEVKASARWRSEHGRGLVELHRVGAIASCWGVYLGDSAQRDGPIRILPLHEFLRELAAGRVLSQRRRTR